MLTYIERYTLAIPFFAYSIISTLIFSTVIESIFLIYKVKFKPNKN